MKRNFLFSACLSVILCCTACGTAGGNPSDEILTPAETSIQEVQETEPETVAETIPETQALTEKNIIAQIYANPSEDAEYISLYAEPDSESTPLARLYLNDALGVYSLENGWYFVQFDSLEGYVSENNISMTEIIPETEAPTEPPKPETKAPEPEPAPKPTIDGDVEFVHPLVDYGGDIGVVPADGYGVYIHVTGGNYAYYQLETYVELDNGEYQTHSFSGSNTVLRLYAGSSPVATYAKITFTPFDNNGNAGAPLTCEASEMGMNVRSLTSAEQNAYILE